MTAPKRTISEADTNAIAALVIEKLRPILAPPPLHEMSNEERNAYANEAWANAFSKQRSSSAFPHLYEDNK